MAAPGEQLNTKKGSFLLLLNILLIEELSSVVRFRHTTAFTAGVHGQDAPVDALLQIVHIQFGH